MTGSRAGFEEFVGPQGAVRDTRLRRPDERAVRQAAAVPGPVGIPAPTTNG
ncbi:hypothetical protein ACFC1R_29380 [Kitasatospora sp. NPDC056138]|uniref:hypothetical protein n=1 Tax=Kitasatospora sp. NPDC056138 TaxID=3345724 RepID=UPI0035DDC087